MATETKKRVFQQDKVYMQGPDGMIHEYEPMLLKIKGFTQVVPNPSKKAEPEKAPDSTKTQTGGTTTT